MPRINLNVGTNANDGTGDTLRDAMINVNTMFTEIYNAPGISTDTLTFTGNEISAVRSNDDIVFAPAGTGAVVLPALKFNGNNIEGTRTNDDINLLPSGTGRVVFGSIAINGTTLSSDDSSSININEGLIVDGTLATSGAATITGTVTAATGSTFGNLTIANGSITDSSGAISFGNENLSTTGTMTAGSGSSIGNLTLADGSITDSGGAISFGDENLSTTGTLTVDGLTTLGNLTVTGTTTMSGTVTIDNLTFNDNIIGSSSNADIRLTPGGTGSVIVSNLTIDDNINITDNIIKTTVSNSNLELKPSGTGTVKVGSDLDINGGTIDGTAIGGSTAAAGTFTTLTANTSITIDGVTITDNTVSANASNSNLELSGNGTGGVTISGFTFPTSDGSSGQFLKTNGLGVLSFGTAGASLSHSDIADASTTVSSSATTVLNTFAKGTYRSAKYFISIVDSTNSRFEIVEANVTHDGSDAYISTFGSTTNYTGPLTTFSADVSGSDVRVLVTNISDNSTVFKFQAIYIDA